MYSVYIVLCHMPCTASCLIVPFMDIRCYRIPNRALAAAAAAGLAVTVGSLGVRSREYWVMGGRHGLLDAGYWFLGGRG